MDVVVMPQLGETVTEGTITTWSKAVGDAAAIDDALFEVSTEKVDTEVPSAVAGVLRAILIDEGDTVPIGTPVAVITATADDEVDLTQIDGDRGNGAASVDAPGSPEGDIAPAAPPRERPDRAATPQPGPPPRGGGSAGPLSPVVRRLLDEHGLDPADVVGTGRDGRVTRADVLAAAANPAPPAPLAGRGAPGAGATAGTAPAPVTTDRPEVPVGDDDEVIELSRARLATAEHMARSLRDAAHALVAVEVDYANVDPVRRSAQLSYLPFVARAVIDAIAEYPHVNASFAGDRLVVHRRVNLGVAVDVDQEALMVPVIHGAGDLRIRALSDAVADVADRARRRRLSGDEFSGGTITITNVGSYGTLVTAPIITQPQVAILSTDGVRMAPVAVRTGGHDSDGRPTWAVAVHPVGNLCLSFDHQAFDGAYAAAFLARVREILQTRDWGREVAP